MRDLAQLTLGKAPNTLEARQSLQQMTANKTTTTTTTTTTETTTDNNNSTNTNSTNNNDDNNYNNNNNKRCRESGLNSLDLDNDNPESEPDLDAPSLVSFNPAMGVESSLRSLDQHEADTSLGKIGHKTMTIGFSLGSLIQQEQDGQEGMN